MSFQVSDAMRSLVPNAKLHIINEDYDTMQWDASNTDTKPTKEEVEAEVKEEEEEGEQEEEQETG